MGTLLTKETERSESIEPKLNTLIPVPFYQLEQMNLTIPFGHHSATVLTQFQLKLIKLPI